ncbi:P-loop containing nucleoside triphosphate hydrolase protein [Hypoxylon argillaceum]|nr:P-loop containing nucleoside triphosphate hydrolase protein [Hypoxylon argillaceum]
MALNVIGEVLRSKSREAALDVLDTLRSVGIDRFVDIPEIIVIRDQLVGECLPSEGSDSSLLQIKERLRARFATETIYRHEPSRSGLDLSIIPWKGRSDEEQRRMKDYKRTNIPSQLVLGNLVKEAASLMRIDNDRLGFSRDVLRIEMSGPMQPHMKIMDLPGLFSSEQNTYIVDMLVRSYLRNPRGILLAVVAAKKSLKLQDVAILPRQIDPFGNRTLGLITGLDSLKLGSDDEHHYFELATNEVVEVRLGWHVLCGNRSISPWPIGNIQDAPKGEFFDRGIWSVLPASQKGISTLRSRLGTIFDDHIRSQFSEMQYEINMHLHNCQWELVKLDAECTSPTEQRKHLIEAGRQFINVMEVLVRGNYHQNERLAEEHASGDYWCLRARIQLALANFAREMQQHGQVKRIVDEVTKPNDMFVSRIDYMQMVRCSMSWMRGRELPGTFNTGIIGETFKEHITPWRKLATDCVDGLFEITISALRRVLKSVMRDSTAERLWEVIMNPSMNQLRRDVDERLEDLLQLCETGNAIAYNRHLMESVQKTQTERHKQRVKRALEQYEKKKLVRGSHFELEEGWDEIAEAIELDMETQACLSIVDWMEAYYKVALKKFLDEFSRLVIEQCLVMKLPRLFTAEMVNKMDDGTFKYVAEGKDGIAAEQATLEEKQRVLEAGSKMLKNFLENGSADSTVDVEESIREPATIIESIES